MARLLIVLALVATIPGGYHPAVAQSGSGAWLKQNPPFPVGPLQSIACPGTAVCQVAGNDMIFSTADSGATWHYQRIHPGSQIGSIVCASIRTCFALDLRPQGRELQTTVVRTQDGGQTWTDGTTFSGTYLSGASCPTPAVCYAMSGPAQVRLNAPVVLLRTDNAGATWTRQHGQALYQVSAPSLTCTGPLRCYLGGNDSVLVTTNGGLTWKRRAIPITSPSSFLPTSISCVDSERCYVMMGDGSIAGTRDGWNTSRLLRSGVPLGHRLTVTHIACPSLSDCYVSTFAGNVLATTNGGVTWKTLRTGSSNALNAIACPTVNTCTAVGNNTTIVSTTTAGSMWRGGLSASTSTLAAITCVEVSSCIAVGVDGTILGTSNGGQNWRIEPSGVRDSLVATSCPTPTVCYAVGGSRVAGVPPRPASTYLGPAMLRTSDGGSSWTLLAQKPIGGRPLAVAGIACPAADTCYATSDSGAILATTDGGHDWRWERTGSYFQMRGIACTTLIHCVAVGGLAAECNDSCSTPEEGVVLKTDNGGVTWQQRSYRRVDVNGPPGTGAYLYSVACPTESVCIAAGHNVVLKSIDAGQSWHLASMKPAAANPVNFPALPNTAALACASPTSCWASFGVPSLFRTEDGGSTWVAVAVKQAQTAGPIQGLDCPAVETCYAVGYAGLILRLSNGGSGLVTGQRARVSRHRLVARRGGES